MKFIDLLRMSNSSLWKRKIRTILTILGVVIGTASIVVMISLGLGLNRQTLQDIEKYGGLTTITVYSNDGIENRYSEAEEKDDGKQEVKYLDDETVELMRALPNVGIVSPVLNIDVLVKSGVYECNMSLSGYSKEALEKFNLSFKEGQIPEENQKLELIYGNHMLENFYNSKSEQYYWDTGILPDIDLYHNPVFVVFDMDEYWQSQNSSQMPGETTGEIPGETPKTSAPPKKYLIEASGVLDGDEETYDNYSYSTLCEINALKDQLKKVFRNKVIPGQPTTKSGKPYKELYYSSIYVNVDGIENVQTVQDAIRNMGYQTESNAEWVEQAKSQSRAIQAILGGIGAVSLFVAAIGIANTMMMSIYERTKEIGIMKVLGCGLTNIRSMFLIEAAYIGFIGGIVGIALSYGISIIINKIATGINGYETATSFIPLWLSALALVFAVFVGMIAGFFPALRAMRLSPLAAIRNE
jgi:ABC-type antimicrobial peptide transport system permease subunit